MPIRPPTSTNVTITSPLVLYRSWVATKRIDPDPAQHRLAIYLQKLYEDLKDYEPIVQYGFRLQQISRQLGSNLQNANEHASAGANAQSSLFSPLSSLFKNENRTEQSSMELTKVMTSHEGAMNIESPRGLLVHGEVGTGKTLLTMDLLAASLPNRKKRRMHYSTFMLATFHKLEVLRRSRQLIIPTSLGLQDDYSLLWLARDMISTSPILFLDEFQFPDRAASKILMNLMTCFFQLGGVLIATSNRIPEDLQNAAGMELDAQYDRDSWAQNSFLRRLGIGARKERRRDMYSKQTEFIKFLDVLRARCEVWEMEGKQDYRRRHSVSTTSGSEVSASEDLGQSNSGLDDMQTGNLGLGWEQSKPVSSAKADSAALSTDYFLVKTLHSAMDHDQINVQDKILAAIEQEAHGTLGGSQQSFVSRYASRSFRIYGRQLVLNKASDYVLYSNFSDLCCTALGPADYVTIASHFHTIILTDIPVFTTLMKNEARRFISLLDALYESGCRLAVTAEAPIDDLFFSQKFRSSKDISTSKQVVDQDATYAETMSEVFQDAIEPFRPNVSSYIDEQSSSFAPASNRSNPPDQLEDGPPNTIARSSVSDTVTNASTAVFSPICSPDQAFDPDNEGFGQEYPRQRAPLKGPDFQRASAFTGDDERFSFKRAESRLWEMTTKQWWTRSSFEPGSDELQQSPVEGVEDVPAPAWWKPLPAESRTWERLVAEQQLPTYSDLISTEHTSTSLGSSDGLIRAEHQNTHDELKSAQASTRQNEKLDTASIHSPFRRHPHPPPKFGFQHFWATVKWGSRAGKWGQGVDGIAKGKNETAQNEPSNSERRRRRKSTGSRPEPATSEDDEGFRKR